MNLTGMNWMKITSRKIAAIKQILTLNPMKSIPKLKLMRMNWMKITSRKIAVMKQIVTLNSMKSTTKLKLMTSHINKCNKKILT